MQQTKALRVAACGRILFDALAAELSVRPPFVARYMNLDARQNFERIVNEAQGSAHRFEIDASLTTIQRRCRREARKHLANWVALLDEALQLILQLHELLDQEHRERPTTHRATVLMGTARAAACIAGVRRLVVDGLEDIARPIARSYLETLDLTLACMVDETFALQFLGPDDSYDANDFWKREIAYGRLAKRLRTSLRACGVPEDQVDSYLTEQLSTKTELSGAVHASMRSAFRSLAVPSLVHEGRFSTQFLGHHSELSPFLIYWVASSTHAFAEIVMTFLMKELRVEPLAFLATRQKDSLGFMAAFFTLQDIQLALEPALAERYHRMADRSDSGDSERPN